MKNKHKKCGKIYYNAIQFATRENFKILTHMFYLWIPCYKLYEEDMFSYVLTFKYTCHFGMNTKQFNPKSKTQIFFKNSWLFFNSFSLVFFYLFIYLGK